MIRTAPFRILVAGIALALLTLMLEAATLDRFAGTYVGITDGIPEGETEPRDLSTTITPTDDGFTVTWTSVIYRRDGRRTSKTYTIEFLPTDRVGIFSSAMKVNVFGKQVPLDPLKGEPFVWARLEGDTMTVFSLIIAEDGTYHMQEYHRTLSDGGLDLFFRRISEGAVQTEIRALLTREAP